MGHLGAVVKRRRPPGALTVEDMPEHLRRFTGSTPTGWSREYAEWARARAAWCRENKVSLLELMRREVVERRAGM